MCAARALLLLIPHMLHSGGVNLSGTLLAVTEQTGHAGGMAIALVNL